MIITDATKYIPFSHLTRKQVAELLHVTPSSVDRYAAVGYNLGDETYIRLNKNNNGTFATKEVVKFIDTIKPSLAV